jgi:hypothetical protein
MLFDSVAKTASGTAQAIERYFQLSLFLLVVAGFATLAGTGKLDVPSIALVLLAVVVRGYLLAHGREAVLSERLTSLLTILYVVLYAADFFLASRTFVSATIHLVLFATIVKMFSVRRERDYIYLAVLSFLMVLAAAVLTVDSIFLAGFCVFLLLAVTTFIVMEMRRSSAAAVVRAADDRGRNTQSNLFWWLTATGPGFLIFILLFGAAIFFLLPRVSAGYLSAFTPGTQLATGFSDSVRLGRIGEIQQSNSVVMHIQIDGDTTGVYHLKWRGVTLSLFDGRTWSNPLPEVEAPHSPDGRFFVLPAIRENAIHAQQRIRYHVLMEPIGTNVFFLAGKALTLGGPYREIALDSSGSVFNVDRDHAITSYEALSDLGQPPAKVLSRAAGPVPSEIAIRYLELPAVDGRIRPLTDEITSTSNNDYDRALAIERYLMTHYQYTLQLGRAAPSDPIANFLFDRKEGHCEYFASSMAVMLRTIGIPSRIVNGFRGGEFNDLTSSYMVRARDAHSWVEVYIPQQGWISFDPTPPGLGVGGGRWNRLLLYMDAAAEFWREWVVNYDFMHQRTLGQRATRDSRSLWEISRDWLNREYEDLLGAARNTQGAMENAPNRWVFTGLLGVVAIGLVLNARRWWEKIQRRRVASKPGKAPKLAATIWYEQLTRSLARRGWRKSPTQTPVEFLSQISDPELQRRVSEFTRHYEKARFAQSSEDAERLPYLYEEISAKR